MKPPYCYVTGGIRGRKNNAPQLHKVPLVKGSAGVRYTGNHEVSDCKPALISGVFLHYKIFRDRELFECTSKEILNHSRIQDRSPNCVARHIDLTQKAKDLQNIKTYNVKFTDSVQLINLGYLKTSCEWNGILPINVTHKIRTTPLLKNNFEILKNSPAQPDLQKLLTLIIDSAKIKDRGAIRFLLSKNLIRVGSAQISLCILQITATSLSHVSSSEKLLQVIQKKFKHNAAEFYNLYDFEIIIEALRKTDTAIATRFMRLILQLNKDSAFYPVQNIVIYLAKKYFTVEKDIFLKEFFIENLLNFLSTVTTQPDPVILGGSHRSGTSMIRRLFNYHKDFYSPPEIKLHRDLLGQFIDKEMHKRDSLGSTLNSLEIPSEYWLDEFTLAYTRCISRAAEISGKKRWVDNNPENSLNIKHWNRALGSRLIFILIIRDPRDILCSMIESDFKSIFPKDIRGKVQHIREYIASGLDYIKAQPNNTFILRYEDVVLNPAEVLTPLFKWLGSEFSMDSLKFINSSLHTNGIEDPNVIKFNATHSNSIGRWKKDLPIDLIKNTSTWENLNTLTYELGYL